METANDITTERSTRRRRLALLPLPLQGHITPMLQLANILHSKGFSITVLHTQFNAPNPTSYPNFTFLSIAGEVNHTVSDVGNAIRLFHFLNRNFLDPIRDCLARLLAEDEGVACLITDAQWFATQSVADELKLPRIVHRTGNVSSFLTFAAVPILRDNGYFRRFSDEENKEREKDSGHPVLLFDKMSLQIESRELEIEIRSEDREQRAQLEI